jgi:hypothetical protein
MKRTACVVAVVFWVLLFLWYVLPLFLTPSGVWRRKIVREDPLRSPIRVVDVDGTGLLLEDGRRVTLAGISIVDDPRGEQAALELMRAACEQGINIVHTFEGEACIVRCEPRIYHWCGNDPVAAHFEQMNLNDMLLALGLAVLDPRTAESLPPDEVERLQEYESCARSSRLGTWSGDGTYWNCGAAAGSGISISCAYRVISCR